MENQNIKPHLDGNKIKEIISELCNNIKEFYIFPEIAEKISNFLLTKLEQNSYQNITDPLMFAKVITNDLHEISKDLHFYFEYDSLMAQELLQQLDADQDESKIDYIEFKKGEKYERYRNFHIIKAKRLPGNIGYIKLNDFPPAEFAGDEIVGALQFLKNSNAFIFDIRNNGGGYSSMVQLIISYFVEPNPKLINNFYERKKDKYYQSWTFPYIPGIRFPEEPIYVVISRRTASAAEEFAYNLKMMERAIIIGETTRGAANPVDLFPIWNRFVIWLPTGHPINPVSNDNWEGKGVSPHYEVPQEKALKEAHMLALQELLKKETDEEIKKMMQFELEYCKVKYNPIKIDIKALQVYQGDYDRSKILIQNNQVFYERANLKRPLITKDNNIFFVDESLRLWFEEENNDKILVVQNRDLETTMRFPKKKTNRQV